MVERSVAKSGSDVSTQSMASELRGRVMVMEMGGSCEARPDTYKPNYDYKGVGVGLDHFSHVAPFVHPVQCTRSRVSWAADEGQNQVMARYCSMAVGHRKYGSRRRRWRR